MGTPLTDDTRITRYIVNKDNLSSILHTVKFSTEPDAIAQGNLANSHQLPNTLGQFKSYSALIWLRLLITDCFVFTTVIILVNVAVRFDKNTYMSINYKFG